MRAGQAGHHAAQQGVGDDRCLAHGIAKDLAVYAIQDAVGIGLDRGRAGHPLQKADLAEVVTRSESIDLSLRAGLSSRADREVIPLDRGKQLDAIVSMD
jgi:hypothetical protein